MNLNELQSLHIRELTKLAQKLNLDNDTSRLNKQELIVKILEEQAKKDGKGAVSLDGRLIDIASIRQAEVLVEKAKLIEGN